MWSGIGYNIDSAFQNRDGRTYFFKGKGYWRFNDLRMSVDHRDPYPSAERWMKCQRLPMVDSTTEDQEEVVITSGTGRRRSISDGLLLGVVLIVSLKITSVRVY